MSRKQQIENAYKLAGDNASFYDGMMTYCTYFTEQGAFELTKIFCDNDDRTYGDLPGIEFSRTGTMRKGAKCCDFCLRRIR